MLIAPSEPASLRALGTVSSQPERLGVDYLFSSPAGLVGVQRKELSDLLASMHDNRLVKEFIQMSRLSVTILLIEGRLQFSSDGELLLHRGASQWGYRISREQLWGYLWSVRLRGVWVDHSASIIDTAAYLTHLSSWLKKDNHLSTFRRTGPKSEWGKRSDRDWAVFFLQSFDGISVELASRIYDHFDRIPVRWDVEEKDLLAVPGIGKKKARTLIEAIGTST